MTWDPDFESIEAGQEVTATVTLTYKDVQLKIVGFDGRGKPLFQAVNSPVFQGQTFLLHEVSVANDQVSSINNYKFKKEGE